MSGTIALVVAAGRGSRFGGSGPKQYELLGGQPLLLHALRRLNSHPGVDAVRVVIHPEDREAYRAAIKGLDLLPPVTGGDSRQESVRLGLESLVSFDPTQVLIHDAARPFPPAAMIDRLLEALTQRTGVVPALPLVDTLKKEQDGAVRAGPDREGVWRVQTPQAFHFHSILDAHKAAVGLQETDDAAVAERSGIAVGLVEGSEDNFKITTQADLLRAEVLLSGRSETRVGMGFDVHRFGAGDFVMLCGLRIPHSHGLQGHSDGDVALHALTDAILGAIGEGDIGEHFPPDDPRWAGADSSAFLADAVELVKRHGGMVRNLDVTLICERPKVGPHREAMRARVAEIVGLEPGRVSVKATTTEGLGFTGRREGIAAQAVATVTLTR